MKQQPQSGGIETLDQYTTGVAAVEHGRRFIGMERSRQLAELAPPAAHDSGVTLIRRLPCDYELGICVAVNTLIWLAIGV